MTEAEIRKLIRQEIKNALTPILMGFTVENTTAQRAVVKRMALEGPIGNTRNIQPYGISSKAPAGTENLIIPINGDPTHLVKVGDFDKSKPEIAEGATCIYDNFAHKILLLQDKIALLATDKITIGSEGSNQPLLLGNVVQELFSNILDLIVAHTHIGNLGYPTGAPSNAADFTALKASPVADGLIKSDKIFTEK